MKSLFKKLNLINFNIIFSFLIKENRKVIDFLNHHLITNFKKKVFKNFE
jgi:hypothetical protein